MTESGRGISFSLLIHGVVLSIIAILSTGKFQERRLVSIDLGLLQPIGRTAAATPGPRKSVQQRPAVQPEAASPDTAPSPVPEQLLMPESLQKQETGTEQTAGTGASAARTGPVDAEGLRASYLNEYFNHIRDRIVRNLAFPPLARKMGWSGKVTVSFVVCRNGSVENIRIVQTTGHAALDRSVAETIKKVAPFPRPPVEAEVTLPIVFRLI